MAYINQETKTLIKPIVDKILTAHGLKGTLSIHRHTKLTLTLRSGKLDFGNAKQVNHYHIDASFKGQTAAVLKELYAAMNAKNYDNSDSQSDYFDVGYYIGMQIGTWDKPYELIA